jgi:hypothetical protein
MAEPLVCAIMLTRDRPEMARRAVECFRAQTYEDKYLLVWNTGREKILSDEYFADQCEPDLEVEELRGHIGELRNAAVRLSGPCFAAVEDAFRIILHWDDDDWSHPDRIAEQVVLLQSSGADCVGYRDMLFNRNGEAWLYENADSRFCLGTSLCYWRNTWERHPFSERNGANPRERGEDREFIRGLKALGVSSLGDCVCHTPPKQHEPRMVARIHAGNAKHYPIEQLAKAGPNWRRAPEWDAYVEAKCPSGI